MGMAMEIVAAPPPLQGAGDPHSLIIPFGPHTGLSAASSMLPAPVLEAVALDFWAKMAWMMHAPLSLTQAW